MTTKASNMESSLDKLSLSTLSDRSTKPPSKPGKKPVAESWEDEASDSSSSDTETEWSSPNTQSRHQRTDSDIPGPPPPTPVASTPLSYPPFTPTGESADLYPPTARESQGLQQDSQRRPEKQTATAGRLIAGALGVRAPKRTEEEKKYDKATREKERKKRDRARDEERRKAEEDEKAKKEIWG